MFSAGDVVVADFPGVMGVKRRPAVVISSDLYHSTRPDLIIALITSQTAAAIRPTDHRLADWSAAGLRLPSAFRAFLATIPASDATGPIGRLSDSDWSAVRARLKDAIVALD